jgi:transposase
MSNFRPVDRDTGFLMPPSVDEWLPERHLARFVVEVIAGLDLRAMTGDYRGSGEASYHPSVLLGLLIYGYATGVFSSWKLERASYDSVALRFIAANQHPDHDTIASFRRRFLKQIEALFVQVLVMAREMGMLKLGTVALDGTKIHADASRPNRVKPGGMHSALSYERAGQIEMQLREEVGKLTALAEAADQADVADGMSIPEELARREKRLAEIARARAIIEARAKERFVREQAEYEAKMAAREARSAETGKKPGGRPPAPPVAAPGPADQVNLTDEESRIMPVAGGGFEQCYNAQAAVAAGSLLVVVSDVVQSPNDKQQVQPTLEALAALPEALGEAETLLADTGYFSEANVDACVAAGIDPLIAQGRQSHYPPLAERTAADPPAPEDPTPVEAMAHRLQTKAGKALYALRKQIPLGSSPRAGSTGVRDHQIGDGLPAIFAAWVGESSGRMETCHHGLEHKETIRPRRRGLRKNRAGMTATGSLMAPGAVPKHRSEHVRPRDAVSGAANAAPASVN